MANLPGSKVVSNKTSSGGTGLNQLTGDVTAGPGTGSQAATLVASTNVEAIITANPAVAASSTDQLTGDVTAGPGAGSQAATVIRIQGVSVSVADATLVAQLNNATTRSVSAIVLAGEETVFTGSTAAQTLTLPVTPQVSSINTILNLASVSITVAAGAGNTINSFGTVGSLTLVPNQLVQMIFIGTVWYVIDTNSSANSVGTLAIAQGGTGATTAPNALTALGVPIPANGYGIAGNTGVTPTPAVSLTAGGGVIVADVSLAQNTATTIFTTVSLTPGTYRLTMSALLLTGLLGETIDVKVILGTATATFAGPQSASFGYAAGVGTTAYDSVSFTCIVTVTVAGTLILQGTMAGGATAATAKASTLQGLANVTGYSYERIA